MRLLKSLLLIAALAAAAIVALRLAFPLPDISARAPSRALPAPETIALAPNLARNLAAHPGKTGIVPLHDAHDALSTRLALAARATSAIDVQYYIWHDDTSGILLLGALRDAARRGVRIRLLLDDNGIHGLDGYVAALDAEANFEIRLFNPSTVRRPKLLGYAFDFLRMNRRMHNKSFTVDNTATIIGGRNIGDEYFALGEGAFFVDLDVLALGPAAADASALFDAYWNSASAFEAASIIAAPGDAAGLEARIAEVRASEAAATFLTEAATALRRHIEAGTAPEWTDVTLIADDPAKGTGAATRDQLLITRLGAILGTVEARLDLVSAYFIPGDPGTEYLSALARSGKTVNVLTNAMTTTDVLMVHSGYSKYRRALLEAGVHLYELRPDAVPAAGTPQQINPLGFSGASLHAKTFAIDGKRVFIGSFNFDPRSAMLNSEMGLLIESATLARSVSANFDGPLQSATYRPGLTPEDKMVWTEQPSGSDSPRIYQQEPGATWAQQVALVIIGLLPVEWML